jgi:hypothetical protein
LRTLDAVKDARFVGDALLDDAGLDGLLVVHSSQRILDP